jgi:hypothetical protein
MELIAITLARVAAFLEILSLDPNGRSITPESFSAFTDCYHFQVAPENFSMLDLQKGVTFSAGRLEHIAIDQIQFFFNGVVV